MPLLVFDTKGIPAHRRERIQAAVEAGGKHMHENYAAWITATQHAPSILVRGIEPAPE